jgi:hypothetical protein
VAGFRLGDEAIGLELDQLVEKERYLVFQARIVVGLGQHPLAIVFGQLQALAPRISQGQSHDVAGFDAREQVGTLAA